jgi:hypothetical protein
LKKTYELHTNSYSYLTFGSKAVGVKGIQLTNADQILAFSYCKNLKYDSSFVQKTNGTFARVLEFCALGDNLFALVRTFTLVSEVMRDFHLGILNVEVEILKPSDISALAVAVPKYVGSAEMFFVCPIIRPKPHIDGDKLQEKALTVATPVIATTVSRLLQQNLRLSFSNLKPSQIPFVIETSTRLLKNLSEWWSGSLVNVFLSLLQDNQSVFALDSNWHVCTPTSHFWGWTHNINVIKSVRDSQNSLVLLPVCHQFHWTLLVAAKRNGKFTIYHFDSGLKFKLVSTSDLQSWISIIASPNVFAIDSPVNIKQHYYVSQPDGDSCGFYTCKFAEILSRNFYRVESWAELLHNYFNCSSFSIKDEKNSFLKRLSSPDLE